MDQQAKEELLKQIYYDPKTGLSSAMALYNRVRGKKITLPEVKAWLSKQETNQIFQPTDKTKIIYPPIIGQNGDYQADLMFLTQYKTKNAGHIPTPSKTRLDKRLLIISKNSFKNPVIARK